MSDKPNKPPDNKHPQCDDAQSVSDDEPPARAVPDPPKVANAPKVPDPPNVADASKVPEPPKKQYNTKGRYNLKSLQLAKVPDPPVTHHRKVPEPPTVLYSSQVPDPPGVPDDRDSGMGGSTSTSVSKTELQANACIDQAVSGGTRPPRPAPKPKPRTRPNYAASPVPAPQPSPRQRPCVLSNTSPDEYQRGQHLPQHLEETNLAEEDAENFLTEHRYELIEGIQYNLAGIIAYLRGKRVLSAKDQDAIKHIHLTHFDQAGHLLDLVQTRGVEAFRAFMETVQYETPHLYLRITGQEPEEPPQPVVSMHRPESIHWNMIMPALQMLQQMHDRTTEYKQTIEKLKQRLIEAQDKAKIDQQLLDREFTNMNKKLMEIKDEAMTWRKQYLQEKEDRLKLSEEVQDMRKNRDQYMEHVNELQQKIDILQHQLSQAKGDFVRQTSMKASPEKVKRLEAEIQAVREENIKLKLLTPKSLEKTVGQELRRLQAEVARLQCDKEVMSDELTEVRCRLAESDMKVDSLERQYKAQQEQTQQMKTERDYALQRSASLDHKNSESRQSFHDLQQACQYYHKKATSLQDQMEEMHLHQQLQQRHEHVHRPRRNCMVSPTCSPVAVTGDPFRGTFGSFYGSRRQGRADDSDMQAEDTARDHSPIRSSDSEEEEQDEAWSGQTAVGQTARSTSESGQTGHNAQFRALAAKVTQRNKQLIAEYSLQPATATLFGAQVQLFDLRRRKNLTLSATNVEVSAEFLQKHVTLVGGNLVGIFVHHVDNSNTDQRSHLQPGDQLFQITQKSEGKDIDLVDKTLEAANDQVQNLYGTIIINKCQNSCAYSNLCCILKKGVVFTGDFFCIVIRSQPQWSPRYTLKVDKGSIVLVTNSLHGKDGGWCATELDPINGNLLEKRGVIPSADKWRHHPVIKGARRGSQATDYMTVTPHTAVHKRPVMVFSTEEIQTVLYPALVEDEMFVRFEPVCPLSGAYSCTEEETERQKKWAAKLARMIIKNKLHFLLHPSLDSLGPLNAIEIYPIILLLKPDSGVTDKIEEMEKTLDERLLCFQYDVLDVKPEKLSQPDQLAVDVKSLVAQVQDHLIWREK